MLLPSVVVETEVGVKRGSNPTRLFVFLRLCPTTGARAVEEDSATMVVAMLDRTFSVVVVVVSCVWLACSELVGTVAVFISNSCEGRGAP